MNAPSTSHLLPTYARADLAFERGEGAWLTATNGERYLDFTSGVAVNALGHGHPKLVAAISEELSRYLRAETALLQPSTGQWLAAHRALDPTALAVLSQNKAYEHTASECEELLFVRGGAGTADAFSGLDTPERIQAMAEAPLNYFERRNFLRHRAHKRAYLLHSRFLREQHSPDSATTEFLDEIFDNLCFADHLAGRRLDLFSRVSELGGALGN